MKDVTPKVEHFRFVPSSESPQSGVVFTPFMGEVEVGQIYPATEQQISILSGHPEWEWVTKREYEAQERASQKAKASEEAFGDVPNQGETDG